MGGLDDDGLPGQSPEGDQSNSGQRGMEVDPSKYYETGRLQVTEGPLGKLPVVGGDLPDGPGPGLSAERFVCNGVGDRPPCKHYAALLLPADGVAKGFGPMRQIRRFCTRLATGTELFELSDDMYACTLRSPQDERSAKKIFEFEEKQRRLAEETEQSRGELNF